MASMAEQLAEAQRMLQVAQQERDAMAHQHSATIAEAAEQLTAVRRQRDDAAQQHDASMASMAEQLAEAQLALKRSTDAVACSTERMAADSSEKDREIKALQSSIVVLTSKFEARTFAATTAVAERDALRTEVARLTSAATAERIESQNSLRVSAGELAVAKRARSDAEERANDALTHAERRQTQLRDTEAALDEATKQSADGAQRARTLEAALAAANHAGTEAERKASEARAHAADLDARLERGGQQLTAMEASLAEAEKRASDAQARAVDLAQQLSMEEGLLQGATIAKADSDKRASDAIAHIADLRARLARSTKQLDEVTAEYEALQEELDNKEAELVAARSSIKLVMEKGVAEAASAALVAANLSAERDALIRSAATSQALEQQRTTELANLNDTVAELRRSATTLRGDREKEVAALTNERDSLRVSDARLAAGLQSARDDLSNLWRQCGELKAAAASEQRFSSESLAALSVSESQLSAARNRQSTTDQQVAALHDALAGERSRMREVENEAMWRLHSAESNAEQLSLELAETHAAAERCAAAAASELRDAQSTVQWLRGTLDTAQRVAAEKATCLEEELKRVYAEVSAARAQTSSMCAAFLATTPRPRFRFARTKRLASEEDTSVLAEAQPASGDSLAKLPCDAQWLDSLAPLPQAADDADSTLPDGSASVVGRAPSTTAGGHKRRVETPNTKPALPAQGQQLAKNVDAQQLLPVQLADVQKLPLPADVAVAPIPCPLNC
jgi:chromosome segregation ATPase